MEAVKLDQATLLKFGIKKANNLDTPPQLLKSGIKDLDQVIGGGLTFGAVTEWGLPSGQGGRELIIPFLVGATRGENLPSPLHCLWVSSVRSPLSVYPPAWSARGVELRNIRFAKTSNFVRDLKPVLTKSIFQIIVIDDPEKLSSEDIAFISSQAREHQILVLILRNYLLSSARSNVWAKLRINTWRSFSEGPKFKVEVIRGGVTPMASSVSIHSAVDL